MVACSSLGPGFSHSSPASSVGGKSPAPSLKPLIWRHLTGHPCQKEAQDTCKDPELYHRVHQGESPAVWCTIGWMGQGHCLVPPYYTDVPGALYSGR